MFICVGILLEVNENNGIRREDYPSEKDSREVKAQDEDKLQKKGERDTATPKSNITHGQAKNINKVENMNTQPTQNNIKMPTIAPSISVVTQSLFAPRSPSPKPEVQNQKKVSPPNSKATITTSSSVSMTTPVASSDTVGLKHTKLGNVNPSQKNNEPKTTRPVTTAPSVAILVPNISPKETCPKIPTPSSPSHNPPKSNLVPPVQSFGKSSKNVPTTKVGKDSTHFPPSHKPPKTMGLTVTTATKEASLLRQVHSCPNSLQR